MRTVMQRVRLMRTSRKTRGLVPPSHGLGQSGELRNPRKATWFVFLALSICFVSLSHARPRTLAAPRAEAVLFPDPCQAIAGEIAGLKKELADLQSDLDTGGGGDKAFVASEIKQVIAKIKAKEKELDKCQCPDPDSYYKLPFDDDPAWELCNGNWDDPIHGHDQGNPNGGQAYAFDFVYSPGHNCIGTEGHNVRAVRAGVVISLASDRNCNIWNVKKGDPCFGKPGEGNYVLIRHADKTVAAYDHLRKASVFVKLGQQVARGQIIALSGNTGNSSSPHVHVDVRKYWNSPTDLGPTLPIKFQDKNHLCWRPRVGDPLESNNN